MRHFKMLCGDVDMAGYGGKLYRKVDVGRYHVIEITNMNEALGRDNEGRETYCIDLSEVDISDRTAKSVENSLRSCGYRWEGEEVVDEYDGRVVAGSPEGVELCLVECLHSYGAKAPLHDVSTNNWRKGVAKCKRESRTLTTDAEAYEARMNRPVNAIGSTAREFARGDITPALERGIRGGSAKAGLMAKLYGASDSVIVGVADAPSHDPLAYVMGYMQGKASDEKGSLSESEYASEYLVGFERGRNVRFGKARPPSWIK